MKNIIEVILVLSTTNITMTMIAKPAKVFKVGPNPVWRITNSPGRERINSLSFKAILLLVLEMAV